MAQAMSNAFGSIGGIKFCNTADELWNMVQEAFQNPMVDYVKVTREKIGVELTDEGKRAEAEKAYREKY